MFETLLSSPRYVLAEDEDGYVIIDRRFPDAPIERFDASDDGFDAAMEAFEVRKRADRRERQVVPRSVWIALIVGGAIWALTGVAAATQPLWHQWVSDSVVFSIIATLDTLGYRGLVAGVGILLTLFLLRGLRAQRMADGAEGRYPAPEPPSPLDRVLFVALVTGLGGWILSAVTTSLMFPYDIGAFFRPGADPPSRASEIARLVDLIAFRVWVASAAALTARWAMTRGRALKERSEGPLPADE